MSNHTVALQTHDLTWGAKVALAVMFIILKRLVRFLALQLSDDLAHDIPDDIVYSAGTTDILCEAKAAFRSFCANSARFGIQYLRCKSVGNSQQEQ